MKTAKIILCTLVCATSHMFGNELLVNGDFEIGKPTEDKSVSFVSKGWRRQRFNSEALNSWITDDKLDRTIGTNNQAVEYRWGATSVYQYFSATASEEYQFSIEYITGSNESRWQPRIQVEWFDANNKLIGDTKTVAEVDNATATLRKWTALSGNATSPANTAYARIMLNINDKGSGKYFQKTYLDNASVIGRPGTNNLPVSFLSIPFDIIMDSIFESTPFQDSLTNYADDNDNDTLSFTKISGPEWLSINSDGTMTGNPTFTDAGNNKLVIKVEDGKGSSDRANIILPVTGLLRLANIFDDDMLLQRDAAFNVWGKALKNMAVTVTMSSGETASTISDDNGDWSISLPALPASTQGALIMTISSGERKFELTNIMIGDLWFCSGQSNMDWVLKSEVVGFKEEIAAANYPNLRLLKTPQTMDKTKWAELGARALWKQCSPETAGSFSAIAYFFGKNLLIDTGIPIGLINSSQGGTKIEPWTPAPDGTKNCYNSRVHPYTRMPIKGIIWYQGESNINDGKLYTAKMETLVRKWRKQWAQGDVPFYYVQLAPFNYKGNNAYNLPEMWKAQTAALDTIPNSGMVVINDIGDMTNIHPKNKAPVGKRLALLAEHETYGQSDIVYSGPTIKNVTREANQLRITFNNIGSGLASRDNQPLSWFEISGTNQTYVTATAIISNNTVLISAPSIDNPEWVRFAWHNTAEPNLMNKEGLPANSFPARQAPPTTQTQ